MSNDPTYKSSAEPIGEPTYRVFRLQPDGGIDSVEVIDAKDDDEAREIARTMVNGHGIDLWERTRFLESYPSLEARAEDEAS